MAEVNIVEQIARMIDAEGAYGIAFPGTNPNAEPIPFTTRQKYFQADYELKAINVLKMLLSAGLATEGVREQLVEEEAMFGTRYADGVLMEGAIPAEEARALVSALRAERPSSEELAAPAAPMSNYGSPEWINPYPADPTTGPMVAAPAAPREREMREALSQVAVYTIEGDYGYVWISVNGWRVKVSEEDAAPLLKFDALQRVALAPSTSGGK